MSPRYEFYRGSVVGDVTLINKTSPDTSEWGCQSFTPSIAHYITSVWLKLARWLTTTMSETITVEVYAADGNHKPTGSVLASGDIEAEDIIGASWEWHRVPFSQVSWLTAETEYCIVVYWNGVGFPTDDVMWAYDLLDVPSDGYSDGVALYSSDDGSTWVLLSDESYNADFLFEEWGLLGTETSHEAALYGRTLAASLRDVGATLKLQSRTLTLGLLSKGLTLGLLGHSLTLKIWR